MHGMGGDLQPGLSPAAAHFDADVSVTGVMIGAPMYGGLCHDGFLHGMLSTAKALSEHKIAMSYVTIRNESLVQRARNKIVAHFLASNCSHLIFIDADIGFTGESVLRLIGHDRPIIGGIYRKKTLASVDWAVNFIQTPEGMSTRDPRTGAVQVRHAPTGFLCIQRRVLETLYRKHRKLRYQLCEGEGDPGPWREKMFSIFDCYIDENRHYLSEDYGFCQRAEAAGFEIWIDPGIVLEHHGTACFVADPMETFVP
jgi:hypothetical protein